MDNRIKQIADFYGLEHQCVKCLEEMAELSVELAKYLQGDNTEVSPVKLREELADVTIMVEQLRYLTGSSFVEQEIERKLERQMQRIKAGGV